MTVAATRTRVGINLLWLEPGVVGGTEEYVVRLLTGISDLNPDRIDVTVFVATSARPKLPVIESFDVIEIDIGQQRKIRRVIAESTWLAWQTRRQRIDIMWFPGGVIPLLNPAQAILTIHDLQPLEYPENFSSARVRYLSTMLPRSVRRAALVTTLSRASAERIEALLGVPPALIHLVPLGLPPSMYSTIPQLEVDRVRETYDLAPRWLLYPVKTYPHKDHATLIRAFERIAGQFPDLDLVLSGGAAGAEATVAALIEASEFRARIKRLGRVPSGDLSALFQGAVAISFPSRYEGFGNGVLEALARGIPVVASDSTSLPEVVGPGGILVEPGNITAWAEALSKVVSSESLRRRLASAGARHARSFTQRESAQRLLEAWRLVEGRKQG